MSTMIDSAIPVAPFAGHDGPVRRLDIVILGLGITSSWGNGHATTYRGLVRELSRRGHNVLFLERDRPWYADNRDLPTPPCGRTEIYGDVEDLKARFTREIHEADFVMVGSYVPDGIAVGQWVTAIASGATAFYDIDTPVTLARVARDQCDYIDRQLIPRYRMYLSFTGGPTLERLESEFRSPMARPLYCSVDPALYHPCPAARRWDVGYLGTYSEDRQPALERLLVNVGRARPERRFVVAGPQYPESLAWPANVQRIEHLPPQEHCAFYNAQAFTLNITRAEMVVAGYSPSARLFEAAACGTPIISDSWIGLEEFFEPGLEILVAQKTEDVLHILREMDELQRQAIAQRALRRVLSSHTAAHRARELESYALALVAG